MWKITQPLNTKKKKIQQNEEKGGQDSQVRQGRLGLGVPPWRQVAKYWTNVEPICLFRFRHQFRELNGASLEYVKQNLEALGGILTVIY